MIDKHLDLTTTVVTGCVANNPVPAGALPALIAEVASALAKLSTPAEVEPVKPVPAINPKQSVFPDYIVCLDDGKRFKSMKRHLMTHHNLTPDEYREKWGLPRDYPIVAPNYAVARSAMAKRLGFGRKPQPVEARRRRKQVGKQLPWPR